MISDLKVFISSKEDELENERLVVKRVIESLLLNPISSEERSATFRSITETNEKEVRSSHIYIGLFKQKYSPPTINEYRIARSNMVKPFIFKKYVKESQPLDEKLKEFLNEIEEPNEGIVTEYFIDIFDLEKKVKKAIMEFLSVHYLTTNEVGIETPSKAAFEKDEEIDFIDDTITGSYRVLQERQIRELTDNELVKFGFNLSVKFRNKIKIVALKLPNIIKGDNIVDIEVRGTVYKGFLDLFVRDSEGNDLWFPDPGTWNNITDQGMLELKNEYKSSGWSFKIPDYIKKNFKVYVLVFEDSDGNTWDKRKVATGVEVVLQ